MWGVCWDTNVLARCQFDLTSTRFNPSSFTTLQSLHAGGQRRRHISYHEVSFLISMLHFEKDAWVHSRPRNHANCDEISIQGHANNHVTRSKHGNDLESRPRSLMGEVEGGCHELAICRGHSSTDECYVLAHVFQLDLSFWHFYNQISASCVVLSQWATPQAFPFYWFPPSGALAFSSLVMFLAHLFSHRIAQQPSTKKDHGSSAQRHRWSSAEYPAAYRINVTLF